MRGSRVKALRREFQKKHKRMPERASLIQRVIGKIRRGKGADERMVPVHQYTPNTPSEWRRVKRQWRRRRA